jgi:hypothetical protein
LTKKRDKVKYPGLTKSVNAKTRQDLIDHDYLDKLNPDELRWLSNFNEEYLSGNFKHPGEIFHKTPEEKRQCYNRNNARNRCLFTSMKAQDRLIYHISEDRLIELIDDVEDLEEIKKLTKKPQRKTRNKK